MSSRDVVALTKNPLSRAFRLKIENEFGHELSLLSVSDLQREGVMGILRGLRRVQAPLLLIPVEDKDAGWIVQALQLLAGISRSPRLELVHDDLRRETFTRWALIPIALRFLGASLWNGLVALGASIELARLQKASRLEVKTSAWRRVLYINANLWFGVKAGGSVGHISGVINSMSRRDSRVTFAACGGRLLTSEDVEYVPLTVPGQFGAPLELNNYRFHRLVTRQLGKLARSRDGFDIIYQRLSSGNFSGVTLSRQWKVPLVTEYNGSEAWVAQHWGRPLKFHRLAVLAEDVQLRHSHLVVTVSEVLREELLARGIPDERIVVYPNCIDPAVFDPDAYGPETRAALRSRFGLDTQHVVITFIGTFGQWHGVDVLARAIRHVVDNEVAWLRQHRVHFLLVGDGMRMSEVRTILEGDSYRQYATLVGLVPQREAPGYLAASDILMSPHVRNPDGTRFFGSPTKLFEYMAMGKAIVASDLDQIGDVLHDGLHVQNLPTEQPSENATQTAVLCEPGSVEDVVKGIRFCVERADWREVLGANARREALAKYTWDHHVDAIVRGLERVCRPGD